MAKQDLLCGAASPPPRTSQYILGKSDKITHSSWLSSLFRTAAVIILNLAGHRRQSHCKSAHSKPARDTFQKLFFAVCTSQHTKGQTWDHSTRMLSATWIYEYQFKNWLVFHVNGFCLTPKNGLCKIKFWKSQRGVILGAQRSHSHRPKKAKTAAAALEGEKGRY